MYKVNNWRQWYCSSVFIVNFEHVIAGQVYSAHLSPTSCVTLHLQMMVIGDFINLTVWVLCKVHVQW